MSRRAGRRATRRLTATLALALTGALVAADLLAVRPNPYRAPSIVALGSGASGGGGGFCGSLPD